MMDIRTLSASEQESLLKALTNARNNSSRFRITLDSDGVKWKVGEGMWTPSYGTNDNAEMQRLFEDYGQDYV